MPPFILSPFRRQVTLTAVRETVGTKVAVHVDKVKLVRSHESMQRHLQELFADTAWNRTCVKARGYPPFRPPSPSSSSSVHVSCSLNIHIAFALIASTSSFTFLADGYGQVRKCIFPKDESVEIAQFKKSIASAFSARLELPPSFSQAFEVRVPSPSCPSPRLPVDAGFSITRMMLPHPLPPSTTLPSTPPWRLT